MPTVPHTELISRPQERRLAQLTSISFLPVEPCGNRDKSGSPRISALGIKGTISGDDSCRALVLVTRLRTA